MKKAISSWEILISNSSYIQYVLPLTVRNVNLQPVEIKLRGSEKHLKVTTHPFLLYIKFCKTPSPIFLCQRQKKKKVTKINEKWQGGSHQHLHNKEVCAAAHLVKGTVEDKCFKMPPGLQRERVRWCGGWEGRIKAGKGGRLPCRTHTPTHKHKREAHQD